MIRSVVALATAAAFLAPVFTGSGLASEAPAFVTTALEAERSALSDVSNRRGAVDTEAVAGRVTPRAETATLEHLAASDAQALRSLRRGLSYRSEPTRSGPSRALSWDALLDVSAQGDEAWRCLTEALYFEARGETLAGMVAVGEVVLNRVDSRAYPNTICGVVHQGTGGQLHRCQFSYKCDGRPENITESHAWNRVARVARVMIDGLPRRLTLGATHYHADHVRPGWSRRLERTVEIGEHIFYRSPEKLARN